MQERRHPMERVYVGLDLGSKSFHVVGTEGTGTILRDQKYETGPKNLIRSVEGLKGEVWVHLEASALARWARSVLKPHVTRVVVSHPKTNAWIAKDPLKRDEVDAWKLAELLRMGHAHEVYYTDDGELGVFKEIVQHYDDVTWQEAKLKVKIKARLKQQGILDGGRELYSQEGRWKVLARVESPAAREAIEQLYALMDQALAVQKKARGLVRKEAKRHAVMERLQKVPGVGLITAAQFVGYVQEPGRFRNKRKLWRYCRLGITDRSSDGTSLGRKCLDRNGNGRLKEMSRRVLLGAMKKRGDNRFKRAYQATLNGTHDKTHARLSTQRKILATMWAMWKGGTEYQDDKG